MVLKPLGEKAYGGDLSPLKNELDLLKNHIEHSALYKHFIQKYIQVKNPERIMMNALKVSCIAEKALIYLFSEENIISVDQMKHLAREIGADATYMNERLVENRMMQIGDFS